MEPQRQTPPELIAVQAELSALEPIFHHPEQGTTREYYEFVTDTQFWEVSASGQRYSREYVIDCLVERYSKPYEERWKKSDFFCQRLAADLYLLTYTLTEDPRITRRATLWRQEATGWKIVYHQGTVVEG